MAVPKFYEFFKAILLVLQDGNVHTAKEVRNDIAHNMNLSEADLSDMLPSGKQTTFANRVAWARTYLDKAGLVETPARGRYQITEEGRKALESGEVIDLNFLDRYKDFKEFHTVNNAGNAGDKEVAGAVIQIETEESPMEILDAAFKKVNNSLAGELMDEVMKLSPSEFETLVVKLLLQMGYGSGIDDAAIVTKQSKDGGIDGIIKEDQLGFSSIYIQAKQWSADHKVGRPEVQKFAGALQGEKAQKGLFITTATFTADAKEYADNLHGTTIVLIDGNQMTKLMIKYNLGVSLEHIYEIKRIDSDFFNDSL